MIYHRSLLGKEVELVYCFGGCPEGAELFASGILLDCTDHFMLIEQRADQFGSVPKFRLRIPHSWILRIREGGAAAGVSQTQFGLN